MTDPADDRAAYVTSLIRSRCPELSDADIADAFGVTTQPDPDSVPAEIVAEVLEVVDHLMNRMDRLEAAVAHAGEDPVAVCRRALTDLDLDAKRLVLTEMDKLVSLEESSHEQLQ